MKMALPSERLGNECRCIEQVRCVLLRQLPLGRIAHLLYIFPYLGYAAA